MSLTIIKDAVFIQGSVETGSEKSRITLPAMVPESRRIRVSSADNLQETSFRMPDHPG
jgi:hypothetical protein